MPDQIMTLLNNLKKALSGGTEMFENVMQALCLVNNDISYESVKDSFKSESLFLACLIVGLDGKVTDDEVFFINSAFDETANSESILNVSRENSISEYSNEAGPTIQFCVHADNAMKNAGHVFEDDGFASKAMFEFFELLWCTFLMLDTSDTGKEEFERCREKQLEYINQNDLALSDRVEPQQSIDMVDTLRNDYQKLRQLENQERSEVDPDNNENARSFEAIMDDLNDLVGLEDIKTDVKQLLDLVKMQKTRQERGLKAVPMSLHLVFTGNPGTGKTTVARLLAELYKEIGVLKKGQLVEVDRSELVAGFVGQTAIKTQEKIDEAIGGILFIDEAYTLAKEGNDFGQEAIDTLLKEMEDRRDEFVVIVAGYEEPMHKFIESNPGLKSRFNKYFHFQNYTSEELIQIFDRLCEQYEYIIAPEAKVIIDEQINQLKENAEENFANGREVRNYFENLITQQASRVAKIDNPSNDEVLTITKEDLF